MIDVFEVGLHLSLSSGIVNENAPWLSVGQPNLSYSTPGP